MFPVESTLFAIEVKSELKLEHLTNADEAARKIEELRHRPIENLKHPPLMCDPDTAGVLQGPEHVIPCVFAYETEIAPQTLKDSIIENAVNPAVRMVCVVGQGCWWYDKPEWHFYEPNSNSEVVRFYRQLAQYFRPRACHTQSLSVGWLPFPLSGRSRRSTPYLEELRSAALDRWA